MILRAKAILAAIALAVVGLEYPLGVYFNFNPSMRSPLQFDAGLSFGLLIAAALLFFSWLFDARTEAQAGGPLLRWHSFWVVAGFIIPIVNLVLPILVMRELQRRSGGGFGAFLAWAVAWVLFQASTPVVYLFAGLVAQPSMRPTILILSLLHLAAAAAAVVMVLQITGALQRRAAEAAPVA